MDNKTRALLGLPPVDETPVMLQQPEVVENAPAPVTIAPTPSRAPTQGVEEITPQALFSDLATPRNSNYQAPTIVRPASQDYAKESKAIESKLAELQTNYKKELADASDREFKSQIFATLGNYLPAAIAGAQSMNTKASVKAADVPKIAVKDQEAQVNAKYKTDYEGILDKYKALKAGQVTPAAELAANTAEAYLRQGADKLNANENTTDRNLTKRVGDSYLANQEKNELSEKQTGEMADIDNTLAEVRGVHARAAGFKDKLGPYGAKIEEGKSGFLGPLVKEIAGPIDEQYTQFRSDSKALQGAYQKLISGLTVSEPERVELRSYIPNGDMTYPEFKANAEAFERRAEQLRTTKLKSFGKFQGKNTEGYVQPEQEKAPADKTVSGKQYSPSRNQTRITYSDGTSEVKDGKQ